MRISLIKNSKIEDFVLPRQVHGNYWITDRDNKGRDRNFLNIIEDNGKWRILSNYEVSLYEDDEYVKSTLLQENKFYIVKIENEEDALIYCSNVYNKDTVQLMIKKDADIIIGSKETCQICYKNKYVDNEHAKLSYKNATWIITNLSNYYKTFVNKEKVDNCKLNNGDVIFIMGLKIIVIKNNLIINNINNVKVDGNLFLQSRFPKQNKKEGKEEEEVFLYQDDDYFFKAPRFKNSFEKATVVIDPAPPKEKEDKTPILYVIGPMLTMGMTSMVTAFTAVNSVVSNGRSMSEALPSILIAVAMLTTMVLWPLLTKNYQKKEKKAKEEQRKKKYLQYIESKRLFIRKTMENQANILTTNFPSLEEIKKKILYKKSDLWEREIDQDDFLKVRLGVGNEMSNIDIRYPEEHFQIEEDDLRGILDTLVMDSKELENVPITVSLADKYISAIVGVTPIIEKITYGIILQLIANQSYDDLKLVFFTSKEKENYWKFAKTLPHCWSNDKMTRYFAADVDEMKQLSSELEDIFQSRLYKENDNANISYKRFKPYYLIITDDLKNARDIEIIKNILNQPLNVGFSVLILNDRLTNLPNECMNFICIGHNNRSVIFEDQLVMNKQRKFIVDIDNSLNLEDYSLKLANIPIDTAIRDSSEFPKSMSFLEMYNVGKVEQLNSFNRWEVNSPINSLQVPIGVDKQGNIFKLDLHEKFHGPHGLIAGMTGSGKSELIITYILSLAVNYHPNEVSFVIIDYKGGGIARAFENKDAKIKLPHIAGTITNLDTNEMNRALVSIESELKRRQKAFNKAREISNESTIDIYKYQKLYRAGIVKEPISHLFIISDEFAELKAQQPDFMEQLISTARIGRSLGVHLILATQKPSGVVNEQIWSNSRFRICLKVSTKEDSMDMLKMPDAALIRNVGRFFLQVGYNEFFAEGLAAWCGAPYIPTDKPKKKIDSSINFVDNIGDVIKSVDNDKKMGEKAFGEQLPNIIKYLTNVADERGIKINQLWLDRIPDLIFVDNLKEKYSYIVEKRIINPIIGEYDDPSNQKQNLLTLNLSNGGNTIVYGASGSGKSILLNSILYSSITTHDSSEVNFYIMDFGSEILKMYEKAPQVGDVVLVNDIEKVENLFKRLYSLIGIRKRLLINYNGDFNYYNKKSDKAMPLIVVIINNYEVFAENYEKYEEKLLVLTRDGARYGIKFVIAASLENSIRYKLRQNFSQVLVLQMNDKSDYTSILGNVEKLYPSKAIGRGLIKIDRIYEFQTAHACEEDKMSDFIADICMDLRKESSNFAEKVATLPNIVLPKDINVNPKNINNIPIGIDKNSLEVATWNFKSSYATIISALEFKKMNFFIEPLIAQFGEVNDCTILVLDAADNISNLEKKANTHYYNTDFDGIINSIHQNILKQQEVYKNSNYNKKMLENAKSIVCIIIGIDSLLSKISKDTKNNFDKLTEIGKALQTIKFVFIDTIDAFKKIEYDNWYRNTVNTSQGIWIGNGISNQFALKITRFTGEIQADIEKGFGYVVKNGVPILTKLVTTEKGYGDGIE